jgi:hypothetical protein
MIIPPASNIEQNPPKIYSNIYPTRCNVTQFIYMWKLLYVFRMVPPHTISSAYNCIYSIWYLSDRYCYLPLSWKSWNSWNILTMHGPINVKPPKILTTTMAVFGKFYTVVFQRVATCNVYCTTSAAGVLLLLLRLDVLCVRSVRASILTVLLLVCAV